MKYYLTTLIIVNLYTLGIFIYDLMVNKVFRIENIITFTMNIILIYIIKNWARKYFPLINFVSFF